MSKKQIKNVKMKNKHCQDNELIFFLINKNKIVYSLPKDVYY